MIEFDGIEYKVFDAHTHWSKLMNKKLKFILELLSTNEVLDTVYEKWSVIKEKSNNINELKQTMFIEILDYYGIDMAICLPVFQMDVNFSIELERKYSNRVIGFGGLKPRAKEKKLQNSFESLKSNKFKGIKLHAQYNKFNVKVHHKEIERVLNFLQENNMIALFHTGTHFEIRDLNPILKNVPDVKVILGHMGLGPQVDQAIDCALKNPNVYLETSGQGYQYLIEYAVKHKDIGVERILYGSDLPSLDPTTEMMKILSLPISEEEKRLIFWENTYNLIKNTE